MIGIIAHDDMPGGWNKGDIVWATGPEYGPGTPWAARAVPIATMPGVHVSGLTSVVETTCDGGFWLAKNWPIISCRKKLNQISPAQTARASIAARPPKTCFFI